MVWKDDMIMVWNEPRTKRLRMLTNGVGRHRAGAADSEDTRYLEVKPITSGDHRKVEVDRGVSDEPAHPAKVGPHGEVSAEGDLGALMYPLINAPAPSSHVCEEGCAAIALRLEKETSV